MVKQIYKQTSIGVWFRDDNFLSDLQDKMTIGLNQTFYYYRIFTNEDEFYTYIDEKQLVARIFLIISRIDSSLDDLIDLAQAHSQIFEKIYIFPPSRIQKSNCFIAKNINQLFEQINIDIQNDIGVTVLSSDTQSMSCAPDNPSTAPSNKKPSPSLSVFNSTSPTNTPIQHLTKESLCFLCFLKMIDILRRIQYDVGQGLKEMWWSFRDHYRENQAQLVAIDALEKTYDKAKAIEYYTESSCLSRVVNQTCHTENMREIFTYRVYISDLHQQLVYRHNQNEQSVPKRCIEKVYRGKPLPGSALQQLIDNVGGLVSMNGFLSTTVNRKVASHYHGDEQVTEIRPGYRPVLFKFKIDSSIKQPYAFIDDCSTKPDEAEVLFSLGTVWRIESVKINDDLCRVRLSAYDEQDLQTIEMLQEPIGNGYDLSSIGDILVQIGNTDEAEWFYKKMLQQSFLADEIKCTLHYKIGMIRFKNKDYSVSLTHFKDAVKCFSPTAKRPNEKVAPRLRCVHDNQSPFTTIYINMGIIHQTDTQYEEAEECYEKASKVMNESERGRAISHNYLGLLHHRQGRYEEAREHHKKAVDLIDKNDSNWIEFERNLQNANQRCEHVMKKKKKDNNLEEYTIEIS